MPIGKLDEKRLVEMSKEIKGLELSKIIFIGRTYDEYIRMFDLTEDELSSQMILDAPAGACSFTAKASEKGYDVAATDIAYFHSVDELYEKGKQDIEHAMQAIAKVKEQYVWEYFQSISDLEQHRISALHDTVTHMKILPQFYTPSILPSLPFEENQFDMILSAHLLFMYDDRLDWDFHENTITEMLRVARREIRIFPLTNLQGNTSEYVERIVECVHTMGWKTEERTVGYEFQKNGNSMLRIYRNV